MSNFLLAYTGGAMAETPEAQEASMAAWGAWLGGLSGSLVDFGAPFGPSSTVSSDGSSSAGGGSKLTGYSILSADSLEAATALAQGCPIFASGGSVEIYEAMPM